MSQTFQPKQGHELPKTHRQRPSLPEGPFARGPGLLKWRLFNLWIPCALLQREPFSASLAINGVQHPLLGKASEPPRSPSLSARRLEYLAACSRVIHERLRRSKHVPSHVDIEQKADAYECRYEGRAAVADEGKGNPHHWREIDRHEYVDRELDEDD